MRRAAARMVRPLERFMHIEASSGVLLLVAAGVALILANSPLAHYYHDLWHLPLSIGAGPLRFEKDLHFIVNDVLMVVFFFVVGLEIRREIHCGELSDLRRAALPIVAAVGGMLVPALIYVAFNTTPETRSGWGVPMATDIAFAVGVLTLLGKRVPAVYRVLLLGLAIIDDIGAILVIAIFYSSGLKPMGLLVAVGGIVLVRLMQRLGVRRPVAYIVPGVIMWAGVLKAGIHPTIAGVILGFLTPVRSWFGEEGFLNEAKAAIADFTVQAQRPVVDQRALIEPLRRMGVAGREAVPPVVRLEVALHPWVAFGIMPIFALANAGVPIGEIDPKAVGALSIPLGVALGLFLGKPIGIVGASLLAAKLGICTLPKRNTLRGLILVGATGGIGFTMAIFIAGLAFQDPKQLSVAKLAVLVASAVTGIVSYLLGFILLKKPDVDEPSVGELENGDPEERLCA
jgi:NhaA family Na+:H+ antiporter